MNFNNEIPDSFKFMKDIQERYSNLVPAPLRELAETRKKLIGSIVPVIDIPSPVEGLFNSGFFDWIDEIKSLDLHLENNPEVQFIIITDLERLNIEESQNFNNVLVSDIPNVDINQKEQVINDNLLRYLERLNIDSLWIGANFALNSDINDNPDKLRHCLTSVRTILEYLINEKLAPNSLLSLSPMFEKEFSKYHRGITPLEKVIIPRKEKIKYFTSKIEFGVLDEFTIKDIDFIYDSYSVLCDIHNPFISMSENQVRCLKMKTGIIVWLLAYLNEIIEKGYETV